MNRALRFRVKGVLMGIACVGFGSWMSLSFAGDWWTGIRSRSWTAVEAEVVAARVNEATGRGSDGTVHRVPELEFRYRYEVGGRSHESSRISFTKKGVDVRDIPAFIRDHPEGSILTAYHDEEDPDQAVLERSVPSAGILVAGVPLLFVPLGIFLVWGSANGAIVRFCERRGLSYR